jgi:hypothetical protein
VTSGATRHDSTATNVRRARPCWLSGDGRLARAQRSNGEDEGQSADPGDDRQEQAHDAEDGAPEFDVDGERRRVIEDGQTREVHLDEQARDV